MAEDKKEDSDAVCRSWESGIRRTFTAPLIKRMEEKGVLTKECGKVFE